MLLKGFQPNINNRIANSVNPNETAHYEPTHLDLHCLQKVQIFVELERSVTVVKTLHEVLFVCVEVLRPSQPNGVMSSAISLPNHTFTVQA